MPTYDYKCKACGHVFDRILKVADRKTPESEACPECGKNEIFQLMSGVQNECVDPYRIDGRMKHNDDFRETMRYIKKGNPGNKMKDY